MPSELLSPFLELDLDLCKDFLSLLSEQHSEGSPCGGLQRTLSACPLILREGGRSQEQLTDLTPWPPQCSWTRESQLPPTSSLRQIPFHADRSVSMIEESGRLTPGSKTLSSRYKTEMCRTFHESGVCKYGSKCQFAHGVGELRGLSRHPKYKTELCRTYHTAGFCPYGARCHFIHNAEEQRFSSGKRAQRPQLLRQSLSCSGIPSSLSSSSLSLFSSSLSSSPPSFSPFSPSTPITPTFSPSTPFPSSVPSSPSSPLKLSLPSFNCSASSPCPPTPRPLLPSDSLGLDAPGTGETQDCTLEPDSEGSERGESSGSESPGCALQQAKRLPIFSRLSD
ncbi:mRNA decay activator protein ZFP36-like [Ascaphus truei]|uniref:mRNA decay activator protein ZFP36-like n=1 Tax=Ascaphus truei TaxID=8439 RepID=UPI003F5A24D0